MNFFYFKLQCLNCSLGEGKGSLPTCETVSDGEEIGLTVKCNLKTELDGKVILKILSWTASEDLFPMYDLWQSLTEWSSVVVHGLDFTGSSYWHPFLEEIPGKLFT